MFVLVPRPLFCNDSPSKKMYNKDGLLRRIDPKIPRRMIDERTDNEGAYVYTTKLAALSSAQRT